MINYNSKKKLFSIHIPKTGGTSFQNILKQWFGDGLCLHYYDELNNTMPKKYDLATDICIHGHFNKKRGFSVLNYYPDADQFITIVRDPLELHLSNYFYRKKNIPIYKNYSSGFLNTFKWKNVDQYLDETHSFLLLHLPWELTVDNFSDILEKNFIHIGLLENLQQTVDILSQKLGKNSINVEVSNVSQRDETPSPEAIKRWQEKHKLEYLIYESVRRSQN